MPKRYNTPHRSRVVKTRLSEEEYADFTARLAPYGISQSEFLRQAIRRATIRPVIHVSAVNDELLSAVGKLAAEYGKIGGNLNQIARYDLPEPPKLADFDQSLQDYKAQVQAEIAQEAAAAGMTVEEYAAAGFEAPQQDSFSIYQLRNEDSTRDYRFEPYDRLQAAGRTVDKANYMEVYAAPLSAGTTLEDIYRTFNVEHPADFKGHSLSVSDVVVLHQNGQDTAHYCDSVGFQQVPEFLQENPLRTAELSTEQNENMIDGVLNNAPSLGELEAKAKAGEQISLTDLAAAVKAEEKAPKAKKSRAAKPKKPSIRAQLDAAKKEQSKQTQPREKTKELEV